MSLPTGTKLGPYEVLGQLGAGGMGEVYRARDTRLDRTVAIKVLNSTLSATPDLKARFEREARSISQLNHPHICVLHDVGHDGGTDFLVMEYLEGESLADRLKRGSLPVAEQLDIAIQVADALAAAHNAGIVHRDLKPGNVMMTQAGAKLLDFGLAKPLSAMAASSGTSSAAPSFTAVKTMSGPSPAMSPLTTHGSIVGTIQYMSPEQIEGREADARSDMFAFGSMLYEMATGRRPFEGKSQLKIASAILEDQPTGVRTLRSDIPPGLERLILACLNKDPLARVQCARDLKLQLTWLRDEPRQETPGRVEPGAKRNRTAWWAAAMLSCAVLIAALLLWSNLRPQPGISAYILPPDKAVFTIASDDASGPVVLSPDGKQIAFVAQDEKGSNRIYVRALDETEAKPVPGTDFATYPFWSPDAKSLAFYSNGKLRRVDLAGGPVLEICAAARFRGGSWGADDVILFAPDVTSGIFRVSANAASAPVEVTKVAASQTTNRWPVLLPDGKHFIYLASNHSDPNASAQNGIYFASLDGKENRLLLSAESNAIYARGQLIWEQGGSLLARTFDSSSGKLSGETAPLAGGVAFNSSTWRAAFDATSNGLLVYQPGLAASSSKLILYTPDGKPTELPDSGGFMDMRISPDGRKIAALTRSNHEIWILDLAEGTRVRFTFGAAADGFAWSADSKFLYYATFDRSRRILRKPVDGSGQESTILEISEPLHVSDVSRDGTMLLFEQRSGAIPSTSWLLPLASGGKPRLLSNEPVGTHFARFSPDGKWVTYVTTETGRNEIYLTSISEGGKQQLTNGVGWQCHWAADGKTIYYANEEDATIALPMERSGNAIQPGKPRQMFTTGRLLPNSFYSSSWDVTPDGRHFLVNVSGERSDQTRAVLITNWPARLKK